MPVKRIRGRALQAMRKRHFDHRPLCVRCEAKGIVREAAQLDHVQAFVRGGKESRDAFAGKQGLCAECHAEKTAEDLGHKYRPRVRIGVDGWPINA